MDVTNRKYLRFRNNHSFITIEVCTLYFINYFKNLQSIQKLAYRSHTIIFMKKRIYL